VNEVWGVGNYEKGKKGRKKRGKFRGNRGKNPEKPSSELFGKVGRKRRGIEKLVNVAGDQNLKGQSNAEGGEVYFIKGRNEQDGA